MSEQPGPDAFETLWTTHRHQYILVQVYEDNPDLCAIIHMTDYSRGGFVIEDEDVYFAVVEKMKQEGIEVLSLEEYKRKYPTNREIYLAEERDKLPRPKNSLARLLSRLK